MHKISVSDEVMRKLTELCLINGQNEDNVLKTLLCCSQNDIQENKEDFIDSTYGIRFAKGFMIFRTYKGKSYTARVSNGNWLLDGSKKNKSAFYSLNQLSQAVIKGNENAWKFWHHINPDGEIQCISELRNPNLVKRYKRPQRPRKVTIEFINKSVPNTSGTSSSLTNHSFQEKSNFEASIADLPTRSSKIKLVKKPWEFG
jgi:hypothetical protein